MYAHTRLHIRLSRVLYIFPTDATPQPYIYIYIYIYIHTHIACLNLHNMDNTDTYTDVHFHNKYIHTYIYTYVHNHPSVHPYIHTYIHRPSSPSSRFRRKPSQGARSALSGTYTQCLTCAREWYCLHRACLYAHYDVHTMFDSCIRMVLFASCMSVCAL
jgi:hypothetical protein